MNILFFDVVPTNIVRFFRDVVQSLQVRHGAVCHFLIEEDDHNDLSHVTEAYPDARECGYVEKRKVEWFEAYYTSREISALFINAQRIPDDMAVLAARKCNIPVFMFQHGMYIPFMRRTAGFFLRKINKTFRFFVYAIRISNEIAGNPFSISYRYVASYVFGKNQVDQGIPRERLNADRVYVYGEHWKDFHAKQFGYSHEQQLTVGYPDLIDVADIRSGYHDAKAVCYVAQTLVEDGRLKRSEQTAFFKQLVDLCTASGLKLYVKLHPRSDKSLYAYASDFNVDLVKNRLPYVAYYVGHYSTLIVKGFQLSGRVYIFEYPGHPTPDYFQGMAGRTSKSFTDMEQWFGEERGNQQSVNHYFHENACLFEMLTDDAVSIIRQSG